MWRFGAFNLYSFVQWLSDIWFIWWTLMRVPQWPSACCSTSSFFWRFLMLLGRYTIERMWAVCLDLGRAYWYLRRFWISGLSLARPPRVGSLRGIFKKTWFRMHWGVAAWEIKQSGDGDYESKNRTPSMSPCTLFFCFLVWKKHSCIEEQVGEWCFLASAESKQDCISWRHPFRKG